MEKLLSALTGVALAASFALPVSAAPIFVPQPAQVQTDAVEQVNHRRNWRDSHWNRRHAWCSHAVTTAGAFHAMTTAGTTATAATATTVDQASISI